jgi:hypothetical protein
VTAALGRVNVGIAVVLVALSLLNCLTRSAAGLSHSAGSGAELSDRLVGLGCAVVFGFGATPVDDGAAADGDAIGLGAQRLARGGSKFGPDAGGPARALRLVQRRRDLHLARVRRGDEY